MAFSKYTNTATASVNMGGTTYSKSASADFEVTSGLEIIMTKTVDRPDDVYYNGDQIIFTITLTRSDGITKALNQITLTDAFPGIVNYTKDNVKIVDGTKGNITVDDKKILTISNLVLNNGNPKITIQVTGKIVM